MENFRQKLSILKRSPYLQANLESANLNNLELLPLGKRLRSQIENHWRLSQVAAIQINEPQSLNENKDDAKFKGVDSRLQFIFTKLFRDNMQLLKPASNKFSKFQAIKMKLVEHDLKNIESGPLNFKSDSQLVTDHFFHESCGLAELYKMQRERKIWWMRFSSDPSRYYLEPYKILNESAIWPNSQSVTIKSSLCFGDLSVEHITLVPLMDGELEHKREFEILNERTKEKQLPTVIRSVIDLDVATFALIFDGAANKKRDQTLFLNRKLAPFQCQVITEPDASCLLELKALSTHIYNVMSRSGLRIFKNDDVDIEQSYDLETQNADQIGIPYTILVDSDSLKTGLLKLRSRDTTLKEIIHITDIPYYLLKIFCAS